MSEIDRAVIRYTDMYYEAFPEDIGRTFVIDKMYFNHKIIYIAKFTGVNNILNNSFDNELNAQMRIMEFCKQRIEQED